ncbi:MAG: hypothetical protein V1685_06115 [Parcubacteria group bacterium]
MLLRSSQDDKLVLALSVALIVAVLFGILVGYVLLQKKNEHVIANVNNVNSTNSLNSRCGSWSPSPPGEITCMAIVSPGFYFKGGACTYFPGTSAGCSSPPFETELECVRTCLQRSTLPPVVDLYNGEVSRSCDVDDDCVIVDRNANLGSCCPTPTCARGYVEEKYVSVNILSYDQLRAEVARQNDEKCSRVLCPLYSPPQCPENEDVLGPACRNAICTKVGYFD